MLIYPIFGNDDLQKKLVKYTTNVLMLLCYAIMPLYLSCATGTSTWCDLDLDSEVAPNFNTSLQAEAWKE